MIKIGNLDIDKFYLGDSSDVKIYLGDVKVWPEDVLKYKLVAKYGDVTEYTVTCDGSGELTQSEVNGLGSITAMTDAVIDACSSGSFKVGEKAFSGATSLTSVTLNEGITELGNASFQGTSNLRNITFPSTLVALGGTAFRQSGLREVSGIPTGVTYLGSGVFADMTSLTAATIPSSITGSSNNIFLRDTALKEVHFEGRTAPALGADAFKNCSELIKIVIPDCDCYNSYAAQSQFSDKTNIIYGEDGTKCKAESYPYVIKRTSRGNSAYTMACTSTSASTVTSANTRSGLSNAQISGSTQTQTPVSIIFGDCAKTLNNGICSGWTYLTSITISNRVTTIGQNAFQNCYSVSKLDIGSGVTSFNNGAFGHIGASASTAPNLSITNKSTVTFSSSCFQYSKLGNVNFNCGVSIGNNAFGHATITSLKFYSGSILNGDTNSSAFNNATIGTLNLGSISSIGDYAFYNTKGFKTLTIPSSVTNLGDYAFIGTSLTALTLDYSSNCTVGDYTFSSLSGLKTVNITNRVASIGNNAFRNCSNLTSITVNRITPPSLSESAFYGSTCPIYVPASAVDTYKSASDWASYADRIQAIS